MSVPSSPYEPPRARATTSGPGQTVIAETSTETGPILPRDDWYAANQRYLSAVLQSVRSRLQALAEGHAVAQSPTPAWERTDIPPALEMLCAHLGLSSFERDLLLLCAGVELDSAFPPLLAAVQGDPARPYPTFSLALAVLPGAHWSALSPAAPLRHWRLLEIATVNNQPLTLSPLRIDERVLHHLAGVQHLDERLAGLLSVEATVAEPSNLADSHRKAAERVARAWSAAGGPDGRPIVQLVGADRVTCRMVAAAALARLGLHMARLPCVLLPAEPREMHAFIRLWERESVLGQMGLLVECDDWDGADAPREMGLNRLAESAGSCVLISARDRRVLTIQRPVINFDIARPPRAEQKRAWQMALGGLSPVSDAQIERLTAQFDLSSQAISLTGIAVVNALKSPREEGAAPDLEATVWDACRQYARPRLDDLAQRIDSSTGWEDLVLPDLQKRILHQIIAAVRQRATVYDRWGFAEKSHRGLGISALFSGASGTGKTLSAEIIANALRLDLYRIDLSQVVSKYIGETEKNLRRVFDAAEHGGAVLLFDEADALFGKRSEVKDSHDRYANIEVSYLLQRMEVYRGLAILTTNQMSALDSAFLRRLRFIVHFPFPDAPQRAEIWRRVFPRSTPKEGLEPERLAQLNVPGGNIYNIALQAAFLAAEEGAPVRMVHLLRAAQAEYAKLEKTLSDSEVRGWV